MGTKRWASFEFSSWAAALVACVIVSACGGGSQSHEMQSGQEMVDPVAAAQVADYGVPKDAAIVAASVQRLNAFFAERSLVSNATGKSDLQAPFQGADPDTLKAQASAKAMPSAATQLTPGGKTLPVAAKLNESVKSRSVPSEVATYRFFNTLTGVHFYTASSTERDSIISKFAHFQYEGVAFYTNSAPAEGLSPVFRFYNRLAGTHLYTADLAERDAVVALLSDVFTLEGVAWYARTKAATGWRPLVRFYHPSTGTHFYSATFDEQQAVIGNAAYEYEGTSYYVKSEFSLVPGTWQPPAGVTPATGNYAYLESKEGDWVGRGEAHLLTPKNAMFSLDSRYGFLGLEVEGHYHLKASLSPTKTVDGWQVGLYTDVNRTNQMLGLDGGLDISFDHRGCNETSGWIAVDEVTHDAEGKLISFELRFEQLCQLSTDVLRGKIRWSKSDLTQPDGPVSPIPANLWRPDPGTVPSDGNMVYTHSLLVDTEGQFAPITQSKVYTPQNSAHFDVSGVVAVPRSYEPTYVRGNSAKFGVLVYDNDGGLMTGQMTAMSSVDRLQVGYYPNIVKLEDSNPALGSMDWVYNPPHSVNGGCHQWLVGWFAIDDVAYVGDVMSRINARFELNCYGRPGSVLTLHGQVRWAASD